MFKARVMRAPSIVAAGMLLAAQGATPAFEIVVAPGLIEAPRDGRLFVVLGATRDPEPRITIGRTGLDAPPFFARDVKGLTSGRVERIDRSAIGFPLPDLTRVAAGEYVAQALFDSNVDLKSVNAPGNLYGQPVRVRFDPAGAEPIRLELNAALGPEQLPRETDLVKFVRLESKRLTAFHNRPIYLRAGVILPRGHDPSQRYPLRVHIGGYGSRFTGVQRMMNETSAFRAAWLADEAPRMILVHLDGDGPFGDPYQVNSANNGPYGDAITEELIPYIEKRFGGVGAPRARLVDGGSTGGWVALALQVLHPEFFGGAWSFCPDSVDFRAFQLVNIYEDANAFVNRFGFDRPSARTLEGDVRFTMRHELQMENAMGLGDIWTMSGGQWGAWNAAYGPRGADGRPVPLWDPRTGAIDRAVIDHWRRYDLRLVLERSWPALAPKLRGKLRIWVGEADDYFLNNAVRLLDAFLSTAKPPYEGRIEYGPGEGHCWVPISEREILDQMARALEGLRAKG